MKSIYYGFRDYTQETTPVSSSLQDQLLKAGLVDSKKAKQVQRDKKKQAKQQYKSNEKTVDESKVLAQRALQDKAERARQLNRERQAEAEKKAIAAQIRQLIETNGLPREGDIGYSFTDNNKIKKIYVNARVQKQLERGIVAIVSLNDAYHLVPTPVAEKIAERDASYVILKNSPGTEPAPESDDEYYAKFEIPDDLMW